MKRTNLTEKCTFSRRRTGVYSSKTAALMSAVLIAAAVLALPLTGCYDDLIEPTAYQTAVTTAAPVYAENSNAASDSTELPWGVTLQADPSILVPCELERVVDGDTLIVHTPDGTRTRVRLTGINAPESVHPDENQNTEEGKDASQFMKELLADIDTVYLEYDVEEKDQYDRTLAYVWIDTGETYVMVNEIMLVTDHAEPVYIEPNLKYADDFRQYEG